MFTYLDDGQDPYPTYEAALVAEREAKYRNGRRIIVAISCCVMLAGGVMTAARHAQQTGTSNIARVASPAVDGPGERTSGERTASNPRKDAEPPKARPEGNGDNDTKAVPGGAPVGRKRTTNEAVVVVPTSAPFTPPAPSSHNDTTSGTTPAVTDGPPTTAGPPTPPPTEFEWTMSVDESFTLVAGDTSEFHIGVTFHNPTDRTITEDWSVCNYQRFVVRGDRLDPDMAASTGCFTFPITVGAGNTHSTYFVAYLPADVTPGTYTIYVPFAASVQVTVVAA